MKYAYLFDNGTHECMGRVRVPEGTSCITFGGVSFVRFAFGGLKFYSVSTYHVNELEKVVEGDPRAAF